MREILRPETLAVAWDAAGDPEFRRHMQAARAFKAGDCRDKVLLASIEDFAGRIIDDEIDPILNNMNRRFSGYDPLHTWLEKPGSIKDAEAQPHRDHDTVGIFFYFNERAGLTTRCIPEQFTGTEITADRTYPRADLTQAVEFPAQSIALIKLGQITHLSPTEIPVGEVRMVSHARYDFSV
ncbi:MAG: hypothetical protein GC137_00890 [Alphaproteobacteria bacterium]|nr:hypothetical protein [Alphaproteobacteria bacterium]